MTLTHDQLVLAPSIRPAGQSILPLSASPISEPESPSVISSGTRSILIQISRILAPQGFEIYPYLVGWYNNVVEHPFCLQYDKDTVAVLVISTPSMFERTFIPFILNNDLEDLRDPIDLCVMKCFSRLRKGLDHLDMDIIHDFELHPNRRPKILAQTAAHVAGAAYLYQPKHYPSASKNQKKLMGVCMHPKFGGWFAIRGCIILKTTLCRDLPRRPPVNVIRSDTDAQTAIELFNFHWRDSRFRDVIPVVEKYSEDQQLYFNTSPGKRKELLPLLKEKYKHLETQK
ncbi:cyanocobalamin reductase / alkylcobalamin dealkylase-like [Paramacrobiotus metropolitanus]|uniref:cyanocobalamin reductase / alkylcobalamin dealkylase-like n=1 Tax=Paramacrobiotus metropolitanus TaxID=2943436 RepID=UPI002445E6D3|nr:cyanocobalamin reductase / alkylcobalamin dealkylase-like [Paramacrobiotus metropolitanus]